MKELEKYPKVKEAFLKWYDNNPCLPEYWIFIKTPFSMQFGAWVDFCDSKEVNICIWMEYQFRSFNKILFYGVEINDKPFENHETRTEARQEAFKQSLTILNSKI